MTRSTMVSAGSAPPWPLISSQTEHVTRCLDRQVSESTKYQNAVRLFFRRSERRAALRSTIELRIEFAKTCEPYALHKQLVTTNDS